MRCDGTLLLDSWEVRGRLVRLFLIVSSHYAIGLGLKYQTCFMDFLS